MHVSVKGYSKVGGSESLFKRSENKKSIKILVTKYHTMADGMGQPG